MNPTPQEANHSITGLPDETAFIGQTQHLLEFSARTDAQAAMLYIAFDTHVDDINEQQNDLAIKAIANRLQSKARDSDIYAHLGGMVFANLSIETSKQHVATLIEKLKNELAEPIKLTDGSSIKLNAKIGAAEFPKQGESYEQLLDTAKKDAFN